MNITCRARRISFLRVITTAIVAAVLLSCSRTTPEKPRPVRIVSWGGQFQEDMLANWWTPAAAKCGIEFEAGSWDGSYGALSARIQRGINDWDLVHVEAHYVETPDADSLFESFPDRDLTRIDPQLRNPRAVPILEYGYVLAYRTDLVHTTAPPEWPAFFDLRAVPGRRALRDFPLGNIEIALLSMGRNIEQVLYSSSLTRANIEIQVDDALHQLEKIKPSIIWWTSGDQLQRILTGGEVPMTAAWSGRVWSAHKQLCSTSASVKDCVVQANERTALVSTDWWIVPKGAPNARRANDLLTCMYSSDEAIAGAQQFQLAQGYSVPISGLQVSDPIANFFLGLGSSSNVNKQGRIQERFWSQNFEWINARWRNWRVQ